MPRCHRINRLGQPVVEGRHGIAGIMGAQAEFYRVVFVAEPRVVVEALGFGGDVGEESEGRFEVGEAQATAEAIVGFSPHDFHYI